MAPNDPDLEVDLAVTEKKLNQQLARAEARLIKTSRQWEKGFQRANTRAVASMKKVDRAIDGTAARVRAFSTGALATIGVSLGAAGIAQFARESVRAVQGLSELAKVADRVSIPVEDFQALQRGFALTGVESEKLNVALADFGNKIGQAVNGSGELLRFLEAYNIEIRDANGQIKDQSTLLRDLANVIRDAGSDQERLALAQAAFGEGGRAMVLALRQGAAGIDEMIASAREGGFVIEESLIRRSEELDDKFADLQRRMSKFFKELAVGAAEGVEAIASIGRASDEVFNSDAEANALIGEDAALALMRSKDAAVDAFQAVQDLRDVYTQLGGPIDNVVQALNQVKDGLVNDGLTEDAFAVATFAAELERLKVEMEANRISAEEYEAAITALQAEAAAALRELEAVGSVSMSSAIASVGALGEAIAGAIGRAAALRQTLQSALAEEAAARETGVGSARDRQDRGQYGQGQAALREQLQAREAFISSQRETNALSQEALALERSKSAILAEAAKTGVVISEQTAAQLAQERALAETRRRGTQGGGGGGGGSVAEVLEIAEKEIEALNRKIDAIGREEAELAQLTAKQALLNAARERGLDLDQQYAQTGRTLREEINLQSASIANLTDLEARLRSIQSTSEQLAGGFEDLFVTIVGGSGRAKDAVSDLLRSLGNLALRAAFQGLNLGNLFSGVAGVFNAGITGAASGAATAAAGAASVGQAAAAASAAPRVQSASGGGASIVFAPTIDATGADAGAVQRLEDAVGQMYAEFDSRVISTVKTAGDRRAMQKVIL